MSNITSRASTPLPLQTGEGLRHVNAIANRLSLRKPQRDSLEILDRITEIVPLCKDIDLTEPLRTVQSEFPGVTDFEREFPSVCFALATGVGKTRLMGAFIAYLYRAHNMRHFFVLAPNLTIYNKLIADFTPNTPKYVFQGIAEFATTPPEIITGDNYENGRGVRDEARLQAGLFGNEAIHINIFNIAKINSEVRGDRAPRIKRLSEYIGQSYFDYLSQLDDLVMLMDESHRYRASAGARAINELRPVLGLELTATPQVERGTRSEPFKNVIYSYPLSNAMNDGFVKEPAVATRENFNPAAYVDQPEALEKIKLEDGVRVHEDTKVALDVYCRQNNKPAVKPFMLVVAEDTTHADALQRTIESPNFFEGRYAGKVITVHSNLRGEERDETVQQLLTVEKTDNPVEIVIHVNMLKEGWDVTNLFTIVPLRAANSRTLVEQSIGRGLRLPFGKRTGVPAVDRLTIISHDKFQEIVDYARNPDSIIRQSVVIGRDVARERQQVVVAMPALAQVIAGGIGGQVDQAGEVDQVTQVDGVAPAQRPIFNTQREQEAARATLEAIQRFEYLPRSQHLQDEVVQARIVEQVQATITPVQSELDGVGETIRVEKIVADVIERYIALTIDIPRIVIVPKGESRGSYRQFTLDTRNVRPQPLEGDVLIQNLSNGNRYVLRSQQVMVNDSRPEDILVGGLIEYDDINYDDSADVLYDLARQMVVHLQSYLRDDEEVFNVLRQHRRMLVESIHAQMQQHYLSSVVEYEAKVSRGFTTLTSSTYSAPADETVRNYRQPIGDNLYLIRSMIFDGFRYCLFDVQKFDSDAERRMAVILEHEGRNGSVLKWFRPTQQHIKIHLRDGGNYEPDFIVETPAEKLIIETKRRSELEGAERDSAHDVTEKRRAAVEWCRYATTHARDNAGKPWRYLLVPHDAVQESMTLHGLTTQYTIL